MSTIALRCKGATRKHLGLERSWPLFLPLGPKSHLSCTVVVASLLGRAQRTVSHPQGSSWMLRLRGPQGGGLWLEECGRFCDKGWVPNLQFSELKGQRVETKEGQKP